jgi:hypothetical protein
MLRNYSASRNWTWPSDTPTVSAAWLAAIRTVFIGGQGRYTALVAYFGDGTTLIMNQSPGENTYQAVELLPPPTNLRATGLLNISSSIVNSKDHTVNTSTSHSHRLFSQAPSSVPFERIRPGRTCCTTSLDSKRSC